MQDYGMNRATREAGRSNDKEKKMGQNEKNADIRKNFMNIIDL